MKYLLIVMVMFFIMSCGDDLCGTSDEVCNPDLEGIYYPDCAFISGIFLQGTDGVCNDSCSGWDITNCIYRACPDGGVPVHSTSGKCDCLQQCKEDKECKDSNGDQSWCEYLSVEDYSYCIWGSNISYECVEY